MRCASLLGLLLLIYATGNEARGVKRWSKERLTWKFGDPYQLLSNRQQLVIRKFVANAFDEWSSALDGILELEEHKENLKEPPDINVYFAKRNHSCIENFDGRGGIVAHSAYPSVGLLHLDGDELWHTGDSRKGDVDLRYVLIHEIGHVLGLHHSKFKKSVMRKNYRSSKTQKRSYQLSKYDIRSIQKLYKFKSKHLRKYLLA
ncbi:unnamed protein product [Caenorhabditis bovis]|uniref:Peptidase metallopeptidase domain-containing protein n=1 Tax=Caenorhabditis bovis TaxID=2654633 RepID=A0A8S1ERK7_9PELO|nr:unnamed protein product [Caenorhabditis bovis]